VPRTWGPEDDARAGFSDLAHRAAQDLIYPQIFGVDRARLSFEDIDKRGSDVARLLDKEWATDRIVRVSVDGLRAPLGFAVQERFRQARYADHRDITITEWYQERNIPAELYRLKSGLFVYGYFDDEKGIFPDAIAVNTVSLLYALATGRIQRQTQEARRNDRYQTFICIPFKALEEAGLVIWRSPHALSEVTRRAAAGGG
jgi:hypothetical protein